MGVDFDKLLVDPDKHPFFCKLLFKQGFTDKILMPPAFIKEQKKMLSKTCLLKTDEGRLWEATIVREKSNFFICESEWPQFVLYHKLNLGDILLFFLIDKSTFQVLPYTQKSHRNLCGYQLFDELSSSSEEGEEEEEEGEGEGEEDEEEEEEEAEKEAEEEEEELQIRPSRKWKRAKVVQEEEEEEEQAEEEEEEEELQIRSPRKWKRAKVVQEEEEEEDGEEEQAEDEDEEEELQVRNSRKCKKAKVVQEEEEEEEGAGEEEEELQIRLSRKWKKAKVVHKDEEEEEEEEVGVEVQVEKELQKRASRKWKRPKAVPVILSDSQDDRVDPFSGSKDGDIRCYSHSGGKSHAKADRCKNSNLKMKVGMKKRRSAKDPDRPKKPGNAYIVFYEEFRKKFRKENPSNRSVVTIGKAGGEKWKQLSDADKAPYVAEAEKRMAEYQKSMAAYSKLRTLANMAAYYCAKSHKRKPEYEKKVQTLQTYHRRKLEKESARSKVDEEERIER